MAMVSNVVIPKDTWVKVASAVNAGNLFLYPPVLIENTQRSMRLTWTYYVDSRPTGAGAPTDLATAMVAASEVSHIIKDSGSIDIYVYCKNLNGKCRVDA